MGPLISSLANLLRTLLMTDEQLILRTSGNLIKGSIAGWHAVTPSPGMSLALLSDVESILRILLTAFSISDRANLGFRIPIVFTQRTLYFLEMHLNKCWQLEGCSPQSSEKTRKDAESRFKGIHRRGRRERREIIQVVVDYAQYYFGLIKSYLLDMLRLPISSNRDRSVFRL